MTPLRFAVIGLGGYGLVHIDAIRWLASQGRAHLTGVVALDIDRRQRPELVTTLTEEGVALYDDVDSFFRVGCDRTDVLTVPIGIHQHVPVSVRALRAGLHVYTEKPVAATVQEVDELINAQRSAGRLVAVGFQHITSNSMRELKARIVDGRLGAVRRLGLLCGWPRSASYFSRNEWTGRLRVGEHWILDSPANNANAHYLLNALYLCSTETGAAANPARLRAELYRANTIESTDTVQLDLTTDSTAHVFITLTHANRRELGPFMELECERGKAYWQTDIGWTFIRYRDGGSEVFSNALHDRWRYDGFTDFVEAIAEGRPPLCTPELSRPQTLAINMMHDSCPAILTIPDGQITEAEDWEMFPPNTKGIFRRVRDLDEIARVAVAERSMFSDMGISWARGAGGRPVSGEGYRSYPGGA